MVEFFARNGFYVIIEDHMGELKNNDHDNTLPEDVEASTKNPNFNHATCKWVQNWKVLVQDIVQQGPEVAERLIVDLANEPDARKDPSHRNSQTPLT